jgi:hypothetical protein
MQKPMFVLTHRLSAFLGIWSQPVEKLSLIHGFVLDLLIEIVL